MSKFDETTNINIEDIEINKDPIKKTFIDELKAENINSEYENINIKENDLKDIVKNDFQEKTIAFNTADIKKIGLASDHRGYALKQKLTKYLDKKGYTIIDYGCDGTLSCDYPEFGFKLGKGIANNEVDKGIAICGSGIGISIACNKIKGVRCAKVDNVKETKYTRQDNDANIIAIAGNMPTFRAKDIVDVFLKTPFSGMERHQKRIDMLNKEG